VGYVKKVVKASEYKLIAQEVVKPYYLSVSFVCKAITIHQNCVDTKLLLGGFTLPPVEFNKHPSIFLY